MNNLDNMDDLSRQEQMIMFKIWRSGKMKMSEIQEAFEGEWKPRTVNTFVARLIKKGYLIRERGWDAFTYRPAVAKEVYAAKLLDTYRAFCKATGVEDKASVEEELCI